MEARARKKAGKLAGIIFSLQQETDKMAVLAESTIEALSQLRLSEIPKSWVDNVWQTDFCEFCELPEVLTDALDGKKYYSEDLKCLLKVVEEWSKCEADSQPLGEFFAGLSVAGHFVGGLKRSTLCLNIKNWDIIFVTIMNFKYIISNLLYNEPGHFG